MSNPLDDGEVIHMRAGKVVDDLRRRFAENESHLHTFNRERANIGFDATFGPVEPAQVPMVIEGLIPQTAFGIVGAGGTIKTTQLLRAMICTVLGREALGRRVLMPGPCLFVTAEDDKETARYRIRKMCESMGLSEADKRAVAEGLFVEDASGTIARLVQQGSDGNLAFSPLVNALVDEYRDAGIRICVFDPAAYFGPGERHVNDGEALLMAAARRISREIGSATGYIHHTGKVAARERIIDAYAGRGGSAFADNARMIGVMLPYDRSDKGLVMPARIREAINGSDPEITLLYVAKLSYGKRPDQPLWILRDPVDPWRFVEAWGESLNDEQRKTARKDAEAALRFEILASIWDHLTSEVKAGRYPTKNSVREGQHVEAHGVKVGKQRISDLIDFGIARGFIESRDMPPDKVKGAAKTYLTAKHKPTLGGVR